MIGYAARSRSEADEKRTTEFRPPENYEFRVIIGRSDREGHMAVLCVCTYRLYFVNGGNYIGRDRPDRVRPCENRYCDDELNDGTSVSRALSENISNYGFPKKKPSRSDGHSVVVRRSSSRGSFFFRREPSSALASAARGGGAHTLRVNLTYYYKSRAGLDRRDIPEVSRWAARSNRAVA